MQITSDSVLVTTNHKAYFAVGFKSGKTVNNVTACLFKLIRPLNVVFLVKSCFELNKYGDLLSVFASLDKRRHNWGISAYTV